MNWKNKAFIMRSCSSIPGGHFLYTLLQKKFGNLNADPWRRVTMQIEMAKWLIDAGITIPGKVFFEVGTGHKPVVPLCFALMGAEKFITVDLNRRMDLNLLKVVLEHLESRRENLEAQWRKFTSEDILRQRFDLLSLHKNDPELFLQKIGIQYLAPADAGNVSFPDESIDCHLSNTVMEHIPPESIVKIMKEAYRLLRNNGTALHFIDLSDHFQHQDSSISAINFLRYTAGEWDRIAGNEYAYTNRLRPPDYLSILSEIPFAVSHIDIRQDPDRSLNEQVPLDPSFSRYSRKDREAVELRVLLRKTAGEKQMNSPMEQADGM